MGSIIFLHSDYDELVAYIITSMYTTAIYLLVNPKRNKGQTL
jgi:hypothetical protein